MNAQQFRRERPQGRSSESNQITGDSPPAGPGREQAGASLPFRIDRVGPSGHSGPTRDVFFLMLILVWKCGQRVGGTLYPLLLTGDHLL
jgi:hypothetical protein